MSVVFVVTSVVHEYRPEHDKPTMQVTLRALGASPTSDHSMAPASVSPITVVLPPDAFDAGKAFTCGARFRLERER